MTNSVTNSTFDALDLELLAEMRRQSDLDLMTAVGESVQANLEFEMKQAGVEAYLASMNELTGSAETKLPHGQRLLRGTLQKAQQGIAERIEAITKNAQAMRRAVAVKHVRDMSTAVLSYLTGKALLDGASVAHPLNKVALRLGAMVEDEKRLTKFATENPKAFKWTMIRIQGSTSRQHKAGVTRRLMEYKQCEWTSWSVTDRLHVGIWLIDAFNHATGLFRSELVVQGQGKAITRQQYLVPESGTLDWIKKAAKHGEMLATEHWPTVIPPKPWSGPRGGGYYTPLVPRLSLVKTKGHAGAKAYQEELANLDMSLVYESVNRVQNTAWTVNRPVLEVFRRVVDSELTVPGLPPLVDEPMPPKPVDIETNEAALKWWKKAASMVHGKNSRNRSKRIQVRRTLHMAEKFSVYGAFYFPHTMDFRGRLYAVPPFLNPQGADFAKGLLTFAEGKPIETEEHLEWLAIQGANTYGVDKVSFADRWNWVVDNTDAIKGVAADPMHPAAWDFWTAADSPFCFLAFCFEWAKVLAGGWGTESSLPVALDGSCNGLQHYSAALRDPVGGAAVNLIPSEKPQDIYAVVAERVLDSLRLLKDISGESGHYARLWLEFGVDRKITKRSVMTLPYGCSLFSVREFVEEAMREKIEGGKANVFAAVDDKGERRDNLFDASKFLQPLVWKAIGDTVVAARQAMDWLQEVAKLVSSEGLPIVWTTPDGFPVQQAYVEQSIYRVRSHLEGSSVWINLAEDSLVMCKRRQRNGIAPNWVHSMDAAALRVFVNIAGSEGVDAFCLVHDSYGSRAADVPIVSAALREAFIALYENRNALGDFAEEVVPQYADNIREEMPPTPQAGTLDLSTIRGSQYFFA